MRDNSYETIEEVKENVIRMRGRLPTPEEMRTVRLYMETLWFLRGDPQEEITQELMLYQSRACLSLTEKLGNGCPIKAAEEHYYGNQRMKKKIELSTSDVSIMDH